MRIAFAFCSLLFAGPGRAEPLTGIFDGAAPPVSFSAMRAGGNEAVDARDPSPVSAETGPDDGERRQVRINGELLAEARRGNADDVRALLDQGAYVNTKDEAGQSPLMLAAWNGHLEVVQVLLSSGAHVNSRSDKGNTALNYATHGRHLAAVQALLAAPGVDPNLPNLFGIRPIDRAKARGDQEIVEALLAAGATPPPES